MKRTIACPRQDSNTWSRSHKDMKITAGEWEAFMDDFQQTLDKFGVPAQEQAELKAIVESTRADIVVKPEAAATS
jgi:truncated hemoglobin YjbI